MTDPNSTIEIFRVPLSKGQLRAVPVDDRNLLLLASHAVNQMVVPRRLLIFSLNFESKSDIENTLSAAQSQTILRFLFGALAEAWEMVKRPINQRLIGKDYAGAIGPEGVAAYGVLKKHFGESNLLHKLRNTVAYHHPEGDELAAAFEDVPEDEDWAWYPSDTINNSFYLASDYAISARILKLTGETDTQRAFEKVMGLVVPVSNDMVDFFLFLMRAIVTRHLGVGLLSPRPGTGTKVENVPNLYKVTIPFFTYRDD
ncbi:MAG: hypothetical protein ACLPGW_01125 [Roseiarcus sp.]